jgi:hypothetical protein
LSAKPEMIVDTLATFREWLILSFWIFYIFLICY